MLEALEDDSHSKLTASGERIEIRYLKEKLERIEKNKLEQTVQGESRKRLQEPADINIDNTKKKQSKTSDRLNMPVPDPHHFSASSSSNGVLPVEAMRSHPIPLETRNPSQQPVPSQNQNQNQNQSQSGSTSYASAGSPNRTHQAGRAMSSINPIATNDYDAAKYTRIDSDKNNHDRRAKNRNSVFT